MCTFTPTASQFAPSVMASLTPSVLSTPSKGLPPAVLSRINAALDTGLRAPALLAQLEPTGVSPAGGTPAQFGALIQSEIPRYAKVVKDNEIRAQ